MVDTGRSVRSRWIYDWQAPGRVGEFLFLELGSPLGWRHGKWFGMAFWIDFGLEDIDFVSLGVARSLEGAGALTDNFRMRHI